MLLIRSGLRASTRALLLYLLVFSTTYASEPPLEARRYQRTLTREAHAGMGLEAPVAALAGQVAQESSWDPRALSRVGARGLAQVMPATATWLAEIYPALSDAQPENPAWALRALVYYDRWLLPRIWGRTECDRWWAVLRSYNGGLGHWRAEARAAADREERACVDAHCGAGRRAVVHCSENLAYPRRILYVRQHRYRAWGPVVACEGP